MADHGRKWPKWPKRTLERDVARLVHQSRISQPQSPVNGLSCVLPNDRAFHALHVLHALYVLDVVYCKLRLRPRRFPLLTTPSQQAASREQLLGLLKLAVAAF